MLPTKWKDKHQLISLSDLTVSYIGLGKSDADAASVKTDNPISPQVGIYYYEVVIKSKGRDGYIGIGIATSSVLLNRLPGWDLNSWGYHGDDGHCFNGSGVGKPFGPTFTTGDVIGCGINFIEKTCFFTKNGVLIGTAFTDLKPAAYYPCVGLRTPGEIVESNFGKNPFKFDIEQYALEEQCKFMNRIKQIPLLHPLVEPDDPPPLDLNHLILDYLIHQGFNETSQQLCQILAQDKQRRDELGSQKLQVNSLEHNWEQLMNERKSILSLILQGKIEECVKELQLKFPQVLQDKAIKFQLATQIFIEKIKQENFDEIIEFGQEIQQEFDQFDLQAVFSLVCYEDPFKSPHSNLLEKSRLEFVCDQLNGAILKSVGKSSLSRLETIYRQFMLIVEQLTNEQIGSSYFLSNYLKQ